MVIRCTDKLSDYLRVDKAQIELESDALFTWSAELITLNQRKTLVAVNDAMGCCFVLYGLTAKQKACLSNLFLDGIRALLKSEYINPKIISKYIQESKRKIDFSRSVTEFEEEGLLRACERARQFVELFAWGQTDMLQNRYLPWINGIALSDDSGKFAFEKMISVLSERYGEPTQIAHSAEFEIELNTLTPCKRRIIVPTNLNFYQFHMVIQRAFEWHDSYTHQFVLKKDDKGRLLKAIWPEYMENEIIPPCNKNFECIKSTDITVREIFARRPVVSYEYNLYSGWVHTIKLVRFIEENTSPYPYCTKAVGDAPLEDGSGPEGFDKALKILKDSEHPQYKKFKLWITSDWWHELNIDEINKRIAQEHRPSIPVYAS